MVSVSVCGQKFQTLAPASLQISRVFFGNFFLVNLFSHHKPFDFGIPWQLSMPTASLSRLSSSSFKRNPMTLLVTKNIQLCFYGTFLLWVAISTSLQTTWQQLNNGFLSNDVPILPNLDIVGDDGTEFQVLPSDKIMIQDWSRDWDNSPIVVEEFKLLFFTVPKVSCTLWKQLFRRIKGFVDWKSQDYTKYLPHNPEFNGLTYLNQLNTTYATQIFQDPTWTKAIFVRDPKQRFLSAFLDKVVSNDGVFVRDKCCAQPGMMRSTCHQFESCRKCVEEALTIPGFLQKIETCHDAHWDPMYDRLEPKYWKYINYVGRMDSLERDGTRLLQQIGAYNQYASNGWGANSDASMFDRTTKSVQSHTTDSKSKVWQYYTPETERLVEKYYENDYRLFQFPKTPLTKDLSQYFVQATDSVWNHDDWDQSPIVVEKYKLIFFTTPRIGASIWKKAFRRMEGYENWQATTATLPHDPSENGLQYLYSFGIERASEMMTSDEWTKAIFLRNPKDRLMSVYNQYKKAPHQLKQLCCPEDNSCDRATESLPRFMNNMQNCNASHWKPQTLRMEEKFWNQINFVGHLENAAYDAKLLLKRIGAWEEIGKSGWGEDGTSQIFAPTGKEFDSILSVMSEYTPSVDRSVEMYYEMDYQNQRFKFPPVPNVLLYGKK